MCLRMSSSPTHSPTDSGSALNYKRSRSCSTSIDNRIAQAMDLVKTHMLSAVREEVEPLRDIIQNLTQRNRKLERENHLLRSMTKYQPALTSGQITNNQPALTSGQITNNQPALTSGQLTKHQTALTSGLITNHQTALTSGLITKHQTALTSGLITNHQTALTSGLITNHQTELTSGQLTKHQTALTSGPITNYETALSSNHHCSQHGISIPERSQDYIFRSVDYQNSGCFSVNTQLYLNVALKEDVRCV
ncbi:protein bunched, class 1/class 3/D/E isoforms [Ictalurus punctatus]|uniref:Protein bunched, class 1/class 3/D/E isoforms n=1 Tax=Ictalurus punctatus TaxID=7998 RepID=A0A2D0RSH2_ICTPU|nr:protein bunched, class 1/class 3/D/E isoforms [Ictalurus punctatus]